MADSASAFSLRYAAHRLRRGIRPLLVAGAVGATLGVLVAMTNPAYEATALLSVRTSAEVATSTATESAAISIVSPSVISQAAKELGTDSGTLASQISAEVRSGTTLIELTAANSDPDAAVRSVTTVADIAMKDYVARNSAIADDVRESGERQLTAGTLSDETAERSRSQSLGETVGAAQGQSITGAVTISIVSPALGAYVAGVSKPVGFILGAAMGVLLAALLVLSSGWRRRSKVRNAADLEDIAAVRAVFRGDEVAGVTGAVLASAAATVIVVSQDERARSDMASDLVHGLRGNGLDVACVSVLSEPMATRSLTRVDESTWTVGQEEAASVLAKSKRDRLGESTHSDVVVVDLPDLPAVELFLVGQADYLPILLVEAGETLDQILSRVDAVRAASPILVLNEASRRTSHA